jgi:hypothetical protein
LQGRGAGVFCAFLFLCFFSRIIAGIKKMVYWLVIFAKNMGGVCAAVL